MKLTKDQSQKILLGAMLLIGAIYGSIEFLIGPTQADSALANKNAEAFEPKIRAARAQIAKTQELFAKLPTTEKLAAQIQSMIPEGSPVAWFPPRIGDYFKRQGIDKVSARSNSEVAEKDLTGFRRLTWGVELPRVEFIPFAAGVAELESEEPLVEIQSLDIEVSRDELQAQHVNLIINNLVRQQ